MPRLSPAEIVDKQITRASAAVEDVVKGIKRMKKTPGELAIKKKDKMKANFLKSLDDGSFDAGCLSYSLAEFQDIAEKKVRERYATGIEASRDKTLASREQLSAHQEIIERKLETMPDNTEQEREARMLFNKREMAKFRLRKARR